jgi:hypothetical protein
MANGNASRLQRPVIAAAEADVEHQQSKIGDPAIRPYGNGVAPQFETDDSMPPATVCNGLPVSSRR